MGGRALVRRRRRRGREAAGRIAPGREGPRRGRGVDLGGRFSGRDIPVLGLFSAAFRLGTTTLISKYATIVSRWKGM